MATSSIQPQAVAAKTVPAKSPGAPDFDTMLSQLTGPAVSDAVQHTTGLSSLELASPQRPGHPTLNPSKHNASVRAENDGRPEKTNKPRFSLPSPSATTTISPTLTEQVPLADTRSGQPVARAQTTPAETTSSTDERSAITLANPHAVGDPWPPNGAEARPREAARDVVPSALSASEQPSDPGDIEETNTKPVAAPKSGARKSMAGDPAATKPAGLAQALSVSMADTGAPTSQPAPVSPELVGPFSMTAPRTTDISGDVAPAQAGESVSAKPPEPAAQLGHALASIQTGQDGTSQIRILLNPAELGSVQLRITRSHDGASSVSLAVERPETLRTLQGDLSHLHQALDRAGVSEQRSLVLHLAAPEAAATGFHGSHTGSDGRGGASGGAGQDAQQRHSQAAQSGRGGGAERENGGADPTTPPGAAIWRRAGVNITA